MTSMVPTVHELAEYIPKLFAAEVISPNLGKLLWQSYGDNGVLKKGVIAVEFPTPITGGQWRLQSNGWVGYIPLSVELGLRLQPKVGLANIFGMLEYAYKLQSFHFLEGLSNFDQLEDFYSSLAEILARRTIDRTRKGLYRAYIPKSDRRSFVRGRMDLRQLAQKPWEVKIKCHYQEQTPDIDDNQILLWTLRTIAACGACKPEVLVKVRQAYHALQGTVSPEPCTAQACIKRLYHRLNEDYQPLHALCRFFLEQSGPSHTEGDRKMLPFLVNMARLYELFVAEWLKAHQASGLLPHKLAVKSQHQVHITQDGSLSFNIDLVLFDMTTGQTCYVLDTKYKTPTSPSTADVAQIIAYATVESCSEAILIYPQPLQKPLDTKVQNIRVRTLTFAVDGNLEQGGMHFLQQVLS